MRWLAALLLFVSSSANALSCFDREQLESFLHNDLDAEVTGYGIDQHGNLLRMYVTSGKNFAITIVPAQDTDTMCFLLEGSSWVEKRKLDKEA